MYCVKKGEGKKDLLSEKDISTTTTRVGREGENLFRTATFLGESPIFDRLEGKRAIEN